MRALLVKDLLVLRRSPMLVGILLLYPAVIAVLIGLALSRGPQEPKIAVVNGLPAGDNVQTLRGTAIDTSRVARDLLSSVDAIPVATRAQAVQKVRDGDALAAIVLPNDLSRRLEGAVDLFGTEPPRIEVISNGSDPVKQRYVDTVLDARVADANRTLSRAIGETTIGYLDVLLNGGRLALGPLGYDILGLRKSQRRIDAALGELPPSSRVRRDLGQVSEFVSLANDNLDVTTPLLRAVSQPLTVQRTVLDGRDAPLETFAVAVAAVLSLMLVGLLLAAGLLALEREEHTFDRLVRGLVRPVELLGEKALLAGACAAAVAFLLLAVVGIFVPLDWSAGGTWLGVLLVGGAAFGAVGIAIGALARDVRAASLLAFVLALPLGFLALVPDNAVSSGLGDVITVVSALFPFKASLSALETALAGGGRVGVDLAHLAVLALGYGLVARLAVRRLA